MSNHSVDTDLPPVNACGDPVEAPQLICATLGDEASPLVEKSAGITLCPQCATLAQAQSIKTVTEFSRWLRECGFSRSQATKIAGHGWPKADDVPDEHADAIRSLVEANIAKLKT